MFDEVLGIPAHPLMVHAAVVFGPLFCLAAIGYAVLPRFRAHLGWLVALLAVGSPVTALTAVLSGNAFLSRLPAGPARDRMLDHQQFGVLSLWSSVLLALIVAGLLLLHRRWAAAPQGGPPRWLAHVGTALVVVLAATSLYFFVRAGHSGAEAVWGGAG
ncbi:hypothetical protein GCM10010124_24060 [Pilimelia terevasa]|uniref:DUF2231 domain-containing protein n=1 Tax=Pilimelia terevasa TaxID=53372 RepID=A0A8J3BSD3_9ACTN|nr:DUF2231 domain-containing protein [Pilimelia terevasa]GGK30467.1 hypothetical protein GCM10010124_24060 [Pilimelia terevasa]